MRIGDAAAATGTTPRALRFYEQRGLLPPPPRTPTGQREYGPAEIDRIRVIRHLLNIGLTVEDVRSCADRLHLLRSEAMPQRCAAPEGGGARPVVARRLAAIDDEIARLTALRTQLAERVSS